MMRLALDTNCYTEMCKGDEDVVELVEFAETVVLPFVVVAELRAGFAVGARTRQNERVLQRFLSKPGVDVVFASDATTQQYAQVYAQLRTQGTPIPTNDIWIAAIVLEHQLVLCTRDEHFDHLPQVRRV